MFHDFNAKPPLLPAAIAIRQKQLVVGKGLAAGKERMFEFWNLAMGMYQCWYSL